MNGWVALFWAGVVVLTAYSVAVAAVAVGWAATIIRGRQARCAACRCPIHIPRQRKAD